jgi:membrane protease subunit HflK
MAGSGGPWGGGSGGNDDDRGRNDPPPRGPQRPAGGGQQIPQIDDLVKQGQERLRVLMGGRGGRGSGGGPGGGSSGPNPIFTRQGIGLGALALVALWAWNSFYTVRPEEQSVELFLGARSQIGTEGLNFAPWPVVTYEIVPVTVERTTDVGLGDATTDSGLMLTRDQNIVDVGFQVVWNVSNPEDLLFNLADPEGTIQAVSESAMRDIIARSELAPILNRDRGAIAADLQLQVQATMDSYASGIRILRVNLQQAAPPPDVVEAFRNVQAAQQERERLQNEADAYANRVTAGARGEAAALLEQAEAYRAEVINRAMGETAAFTAVFNEYVLAPEVTRRRMYLETMERVFGDINKVILDGTAGGEGGQGVVPFLPLNELNRLVPAAPQTGAAATAGSTTGTGSTN